MVGYICSRLELESIGVGVGVDFTRPKMESELESLKLGRPRSPDCTTLQDLDDARNKVSGMGLKWDVPLACRVHLIDKWLYPLLLNGSAYDGGVNGMLHDIIYSQEHRQPLRPEHICCHCRTLMSIASHTSF